MNPRQIHESCRVNPNYTHCSDQENNFNSLIFWNSDRRTIIDRIEVFKINDAPELEDGSNHVKKLFHGPLFQNEPCQFDVQMKRCVNHLDPVAFTEKDAFYVNMAGIGADPAIRNFGYVLYGSVITKNILIRDPEDNADMAEYFFNYDTIHDYGNNKFLRASEDFFPTHIIFYHRKQNSRLNGLGYQPYQIERMNPLPPPAIYINVPLDEESLQEVFKGDRIDIRVVSVQKIVNPILEEYYNQAKDTLGPEDEITELRVFHGIPFERADAVARFNLDWRKCQYGKYGWGIHFGQSPHNAKYFPYRYPTGRNRKRCMLAFDMIARYAIDRAFEDINDITSPPVIMGEQTDTIEVTRTGSIIKFDDHQFIPRFKIVYYDDWN